MPAAATPGKLRSAERNLAGRYRSADLHGKVRHPSSGPVTFYTDGSVSKQPVASKQGVASKIGHPTGWGYVATDGRYGCGRYPQFDGKAGDELSTVTELRAVWHAIGRILDNEPVTIVTDSLDAARLLTAWQTGSTRMPPGYTSERGAGRKTSTLEKLRRMVAANPGHLTVQTVEGHAGDVLNEAADTLAQLGMRWARDNLTKDDVDRRAAGIAEGFLAQHRSRE